MVIGPHSPIVLFTLYDNNLVIVAFFADETMLLLLKPFNRPPLSVSDQDENPSDDMPIMAVMVALSSLLVIIFIIIILYMLRYARLILRSLKELCGGN